MTTCTHCHTPDPTGSTLCVHCTARLVDQLTTLPRMYEALGVLLAPSMATGQGRGGKGGPAPLPLDGGMFDLRREFDRVYGWLSAVHDARHIRTPRLAGDTLTRLHTAVAGLLAHMPWIVSGWPAAGDLAAEIAELHRAAASVVDPDPRPRGRRIGHCPAAHTDGSLCGSVLRLPPGETVARCDWCGTTWPPATWTQLKAWQTEDANAA